MLVNPTLFKLYWGCTALGIALGLAGVVMGLYFAIAICVLQTAHYLLRARSAKAFPVQVRIAFLGLLIAGLWAPLTVIHWIQLVGTTALLLFGYCFLARALSLMPWNRSHALSLGLIRRTIFSAPVKGSIMEARHAPEAAAAA
ncbi:MAG: hypothetical protein IH604_20220 [Burkholderiales bacterium]|nr:hypothetical protein [Burkholderiales bacterium]